jgi:hypothetical protein
LRSVDPNLFHFIALSFINSRFNRVGEEGSDELALTEVEEKESAKSGEMILSDEITKL